MGECRPAEPPRIRVLRITTSPLALWSFFRNITGFLGEHGFETLAVSSPGQKLDEFHAWAGVPVQAVEMKRRISPLSDLPALWRLWRIVRRYRPDIVHAHTPKAGLLGMLAAWLALVKVRVYTIHGLPLLTRTGWQFHVLRLAETLACRLATSVNCVSHSVRRVVLDLGICPEAKVRTLGYGSCSGVDLQRFDPAACGPADRARVRAQYGIPEDALLAGFIGRIVRDKGIRELAAAWQRLRVEFPNLHLLCCGEFEPQDPVPAEVRECLQNDPRVHFTDGFVADMPPVYAALEVCVLPTYREGLPTVALECGAMQVPLVATRVPGCTDAVRDGVTGLLVEAQSAEALFYAIARLLRDPRLAKEMGRAAREFVRVKFSEEIVFGNVLDEYRRLLRESRSRPGFRERLADVCGALAGLAVFAPLLAAVWMAIRLRMGRPVLFRQFRAGRGGRPFLLYKFRTMLEARDSAGALLPDSERLTRLGRFLRATSLDELPQLWNVLKGEMSLVGPRPLHAEYVARYTPEQRRRLEVKPGLTGWAQIHGRNAIAWERKFELDVWYVENRSLALDLRILAATLGQLLRRDRRGIGNAGHATMPEYLGPPVDPGAEAAR
jgi:lipopolysaccharide/colanic/teichoic acid biosynthesis glycosyltransferase/glycosyltransferase involved in cell wall biosynthesis